MKRVLALVFCGFLAIHSVKAGLITIPGKGIDSTQTSQPWQIKVNGVGLAYKGSGGLNYEVFVNNLFKAGFQDQSPKELNNELYAYYQKLEVGDKLEIILLNHDFLPVKVTTGRTELVYEEDQIVLEFLAGQKHTYYVEFVMESPLEFFYIDASGGINNLRLLEAHIYGVAERGADFIVYYNSPSGHMVFREKNRLPQLFNALFTSITQPPFAREELGNVEVLLDEYLGENTQTRAVNVSFYVSDISYDRLSGGFFTPLVKEVIPSRALRQGEVVVYTDFDVKEKIEGFTYVNLTL